MGIYYNNFIYYGVVLTTEQYDQLTKTTQYKENVDVYQTYLKACGEHYILHIPQTYYNFDNMGQMFEAHEIKQGFVLGTEIQLILQNRGVFKPLFELHDYQKKIIEDLVSFIVNDTVIDLDFRMSQCVWTTLDYPRGGISFEYTLRVKF